MYNKEQLYRRVVNIYTEKVPNPNSMKFVMNFMITADESLSRDYPDAASTADSPLAEALFAFPYVQRVFITKNFVTVTKDEQTDWDEIIGELKAFLKEYLEEGNEVLIEAQEADDVLTNISSEQDTPTVRQIKDILEEYIRPAVEGDGGAITFHSFETETGKVKVLLQGSCSGCPSSTITLKAGIENLLTRMVPEVRTVEAESI